MTAVFLAGAAAPDPAAEVRRDTALRAAEAALPASDRVVLRAMGTFRGRRENGRVERSPGNKEVCPCVGRV